VSEAREGFLGDIRGRALWVVLGCLVCQIGLGFGYADGALAPAMLEDLGFTRAEFSSGRAPQLWVIALSSPLVGFACSRFGARAVLSVAALLLAGGYASVAATQSWWQFTLSWAVIGLGVAGVGDIAVGGVVTQWVRRNRALALGIVYCGSNLGGWLVIRAVAYVGEARSWREALLWVCAGGALLLFPFGLLAVRDRPGGAIAEDEPAAAAEATTGLTAREALRTRSFWILFATLLSFGLFFLALLQHLVLFLTDSGMPRVEAAEYQSNAIGIGIASKLGFGFVADRIGPRASMLVDYGLLTLAALLLLVLPDPLLVWVFVAAFGFSTAARDVVTPLMITHCFGVKHLAEIYGLLMLTLLPGGTLGPIFAGAVHDATGSYTGAFVTFAALNGLSWLALTQVGDERGPAQRGRAGRAGLESNHW
jgi:predicted MFS family arabinose efflux permease